MSRAARLSRSSVADAMAPIGISGMGRWNMYRGGRARIFAGWALAAALFAGPSGAEPPPAGGSSKGSGAKAQDGELSGEAKAEVMARYTKAEQLFKKREFRLALEAYREVLKLKKYPLVLGQIASCQRELGDFVAALATYEAVLPDLPNLSAPDRDVVNRAVSELRSRVGTLAISGAALTGATLSIDGEERGKLPPSAPLRVSSGDHVLRAALDGFEPIVKSVHVKGGETLPVQLEVSSPRGRLVVSEKHNWSLHVEIDGKDRGPTPWTDTVTVGSHTVRLLGPVDPRNVLECRAPRVDAAGKPVPDESGQEMESDVETVVVGLFETKSIVHEAKPIDAAVHIGSKPLGATVVIDSKEVGPTPWDGRLALGNHSVSVTARGFLPATEQMTIAPRVPYNLEMRLEPESVPDSGNLRRARDVGAIAGFSLGALGLGVFGVTGALALDKVNGLKASCPGLSCYRKDNDTLDTANALGTASTIGLVVGGLGVVTGTVMLLAIRPPAGGTSGGGSRPASKSRLGPSVSLGVRPGGVSLEGRF